MPKVIFITPAGNEVVVSSDESNLMEAAITNGVEGILGDCDGVASCATCQVHIDPLWIDKVGPATDVELEMLEFEDSANENSRLGCQVELTPEMDGLVVRVVGQQG